MTIRDRLVNQSTVEAFAVQTTHPTTGASPRSTASTASRGPRAARYKDADGTLPIALPPGTETTIVRQQFTILGLDSLWLPAAYEPQAVLEDGDLDPTYEAESGTLTVGDGMRTADGATYLVESRIPTRDPIAITDAARGRPRRHPRPLHRPARRLQSRRHPRGRAHHRRPPTPYSKALLLQEFFRDHFTYSLNVENGHGNDAIERFLETRVGYCEQFAGTYAAMARAIGLPARVAVGFTPGEPDADGIYRVEGRNAHAWPEVYITGVGWLRFEPTPNRGAPDDQIYTGVPPEQANASGSTSLLPAPGLDPAARRRDDPRSQRPGDRRRHPAVRSRDRHHVRRACPKPTTAAPLADLLPLLGVLVGVAALALIAIPIAKRVRRTRRRSQLRSSPRGHVDAAWEAAIEALGLLDIPWIPPRRHQELARRASRVIGADTAPASTDLANLTTEARFGPVEPDRATQAEADGMASRIRHRSRTA